MADGPDCMRGCAGDGWRVRRAFALAIEQMDGVFILFQVFGWHAYAEAPQALRQLK